VRLSSVLEMAPAVQSGRGQGRERGPLVNLSDIPELLPGAQPNANPAQREEFEARCRKLHNEEEAERRKEARANNLAAGVGPPSASSELEAMFPALDADLIRAILADAGSTQRALETLLALSAATSDPSGLEASAAASVPKLPPRNIGVEDHDKFPCLLDSDGWQAISTREIDRIVGGSDEEDLGGGCAWSERAKAAADLPVPRKAPIATTVAMRRRRKQQTDKEVDEQVQPLTDYDVRKQAGQRREKHRALYGRCGRGAANGRGGAGSGVANGADPMSEEDEEEEAGAAEEEVEES